LLNNSKIHNSHKEKNTLFLCHLLPTSQNNCLFSLLHTCRCTILTINIFSYVLLKNTNLIFWKYPSKQDISYTNIYLYKNEGFQKSYNYVNKQQFHILFLCRSLTKVVQLCQQTTISYFAPMSLTKVLQLCQQTTINHWWSNQDNHMK
jgi:hypothetical protein